MKKFLLFFIFIITVKIIFCQGENFKLYVIEYNKFIKDGKLDSALIVSKKMNNWVRENEGSDTSLNFAKSHLYIGAVFDRKKEYDSAIAQYTNHIQILENQNRIYSNNYINALYLIGNVYIQINDLELADKNFLKLFEIKEKVVGLDTISLFKNLRNIGINYFERGQLSLSKRIFSYNLEISKLKKTNSSNLFAEACNDLAIVLDDLNEFDSVVILYNASLESRKLFSSNDSDGYAKVIHNLGTFYHKRGELYEAVRYYKESIKIFSTNNSKSESYITNLTNLGALYSDIGDYSNAKNLYIQALSLKETKSTSTLINLGSLYLRMNDFVKADSCYKDALVILSNKYPRSLNYSKALNNYGSFLDKKNDNVNAEVYYNKSLDIKKSIFTGDNIDISNSYRTLGNLYFKTKNYIKAEEFYNKSFQVVQSILGDNNINTFTISNSLAKVYIKTNRYKEAFKIYKSNFIFLNKYIIQNFDWLNDSQKDNIWTKYNFFYDLIDQFSVLYADSISEVSGLNYNSILFTKGKLLQSINQKNNQIYDITKIKEQLIFLRKKIAKSIDDENSTEYKKLEADATIMENQLTDLWSEYRIEKTNASITWQEIQANLSNEEAAIEFVKYRSESDSNYYYNALVLTKTSDHPILVKLSSEQELLKILPEKGFSSYYPLVWAPLEKYLNGIKSIYYCPIGVLNNIPFHALYKQKNGGDVIERDFGFPMAENGADFLLNKYRLHRLSSTRHLAMGLKVKALEKIDKSIASFGGANYDYFPDLKNTKYNSSDVLMRSLPNNKKFSYLESSKIEVQNINNKLNSEGWKSDLFEGIDANEANFSKFQDDSAKAILHIATHGFVLPDFSKTFFDLNNSSLEYKLSHNLNPLKRSGLILAGGNWAWGGSEILKQEKIDLDYGILTAAKISELNLRGTKLVVLSACNTGLGTIRGKEGVYGLIRAFKLAGVEQIIVSLWEVPDYYTSELMTYFYDDLSITQNAIVSFEKAQKIMQKKHPRRPDWWAAFVLIR